VSASSSALSSTSKIVLFTGIPSRNIWRESNLCV
jgi:hypothetical protein